MNFLQLVQQYVTGVISDQDAQRFCAKEKLDQQTVPQEIVLFLAAFHAKKILTKTDFTQFSENLAKIKEHNAHDCIIGVLNYIARASLYASRSSIDVIAAEIERQIRTEGKLNFNPENQIDKFCHLLNIYILYPTALPVFRQPRHYSEFPGQCFVRSRYVSYNDELTLDLPCAINTLILAKKLPAAYAGLDLQKPFQVKPKSQSLPIKRGVKDSNLYFVFKRARKEFVGDTPDNVLLATNGSKLLFLKGMHTLHPISVFASKIASFVSKNHFSSERWLDNGLGASTALREYHISLPTLYKKNKDKFKSLTKFPAGTGVIDEVLNFLADTDPNSENFGFSSEDLASGHFSRIDYDYCSLANLTAATYETNRLSSKLSASSVNDFQVYNKEKLSARLKLATMPAALFAAIAEKVFFDAAAKSAAINEYVSRADIALTLFLNHPDALVFVRTHLEILSSLFQEGYNYIEKHFDKATQEKVIPALHERMMQVKEKFNQLRKSPSALPSVAANPASLFAVQQSSKIIPVGLERLCKVIDSYGSENKVFGGIKLIFKDEQAAREFIKLCDSLFKKDSSLGVKWVGSRLSEDNVLAIEMNSYGPLHQFVKKDYSNYGELLLAEFKQFFDLSTIPQVYTNYKCNPSPETDMSHSPKP